MLRSKPPWRILFFGTDDFSLRTLQALNENRMMPGDFGKRVVDALDLAHPKLKKLSPVNKYADLCNITQYEWPFSSHRRPSYDVGVVASFGHLIPRKIVKAFPYGILNVHPSLLPRWRGAAPLHHTILNGDTESGVSIMAIQPKHFDIGPLVAQKELSVAQFKTFTSLRDYLGLEGGKMIIDVLSKMPELLSSQKPQSSEGITYAHKIPQKTYIDWKNQTVSELDRQYRALFETAELRSTWQDTSIRLLDMVQPGTLEPRIPLDPNSPPGLPIFDKFADVMWVRCKDDWAGFVSILIKKKMSANAFYNGYLSKKHLKGVCFASKPNNLFNENYTRWIAHPRPL